MDTRSIHLFEKPKSLSTLIRSGLVLFLDASDSSSMTNDGGGLISQLRDKSGQNNNANATTTARPTLIASAKAGKSVLRFNGSANFLTLTSTIILSGEFTRFIVVMNTQSTGNRFYFGHTTNQKEGYSSGTPIKYALRVVTSVDVANDYPITVNNYGIIFSARDSGNIVQWGSNNTPLSNLFSGAAQAGNTAMSQIGKDEVTSFWNGDIAEVLIYNRRLSPSEVDSVKQYLNSKWQIY